MAKFLAAKGNKINARLADIQIAVVASPKVIRPAMKPSSSKMTLEIQGIESNQFPESRAGSGTIFFKKLLRFCDLCSSLITDS